MQPRFSSYWNNPSYDPTAHRYANNLFAEQLINKAHRTIQQWQAYQATPLLELSDIRGQLGVSAVYYKDESSRFGLSSFKALGGAYAVQTLAESFPGDLVVSSATDGNHGRSVAWGASRFGVECHIFIHQNVSQARAAAMQDYGAVVHRVPGNYDDSIVACNEASKEQGWQIVSDTSWLGYHDIPRQVMAGYTLMAAEIIEQLNGEVPSHIFLPAGCGGLAAAMIAYFWQNYRDALPSVVIVESDKADCVLRSLRQDTIFCMPIVEETLMAGLSCGEVSQLAWPLLKYGAEHLISIPDDSVAPLMRRLAKAHGRRASIEAGECSTAGLAALLAASASDELSAQLNVTAASKILLFGTEGASDRAYYQSVICANK